MALVSDLGSLKRYGGVRLSHCIDVGSETQYTRGEGTIMNEQIEVVKQMNDAFATAAVGSKLPAKTSGTVKAGYDATRGF